MGAPSGLTCTSDISEESGQPECVLNKWFHNYRLNQSRGERDLGVRLPQWGQLRRELKRVIRESIPLCYYHIASVYKLRALGSPVVHCSLNEGAKWKATEVCWPYHTLTQAELMWEPPHFHTNDFSRVGQYVARRTPFFTVSIDFCAPSFPLLSPHSCPPHHFPAVFHPLYALL